MIRQGRNTADGGRYGRGIDYGRRRRGMVIRQARGGIRRTAGGWVIWHEGRNTAVGDKWG